MSAGTEEVEHVGGRWTAEEDELLREGVKKLGARNWKQISTDFLLNRRSDVQCLHRWQKVLRPGLVKGPWTPEEDRIIIECRKAGITKWSEISERIPGRIGKQCRERWFNHLDPTIKKSPWSPQEDKILEEAQSQFGNRWCEIAKLLPGRSENSVKNRWNSAMRKKVQRPRGRSEERSSSSSSGGGGGGGGGGVEEKKVAVKTKRKSRKRRSAPAVDDVTARRAAEAVWGKWGGGKVDAGGAGVRPPAEEAATREAQRRQDEGEDDKPPPPDGRGGGEEEEDGEEEGKKGSDPPREGFHWSMGMSPGASLGASMESSPGTGFGHTPGTGHSSTGYGFRSMPTSAAPLLPVEGDLSGAAMTRLSALPSSAAAGVHRPPSSAVFLRPFGFSSPPIPDRAPPPPSGLSAAGADDLYAPGMHESGGADVSFGSVGSAVSDRMARKRARGGAGGSRATQVGRSAAEVSGEWDVPVSGPRKRNARGRFVNRQREAMDQGSGAGGGRFSPGQGSEDEESDVAPDWAALARGERPSATPPLPHDPLTDRLASYPQPPPVPMGGRAPPPLRARVSASASAASAAGPATPIAAPQPARGGLLRGPSPPLGMPQVPLDPSGSLGDLEAEMVRMSLGEPASGLTLRGKGLSPAKPERDFEGHEVLDSWFAPGADEPRAPRTSFPHSSAASLSLSASAD